MVLDDSVNTFSLFFHLIVMIKNRLRLLIQSLIDSFGPFLEHFIPTSFRSKVISRADIVPLSKWSLFSAFFIFFIQENIYMTTAGRRLRCSFCFHNMVATCWKNWKNWKMSTFFLNNCWKNWSYILYFRWENWKTHAITQVFVNWNCFINFLLEKVENQILFQQLLWKYDGFW